MIWFGVAGGSAALGLSLLYQRYVRRDSQAVRSGGGFTLFAVSLLICAVGAAIAGVAYLRTSR